MTTTTTKSPPAVATTSASSASILPETLSPSVQDQVDVGTAKILTSQHVSQGPGRIANAPVPSVFSDDRGDIHRLRVGHTSMIGPHPPSSSSSSSSPLTSRGTRVNLLYSKGNVMRSGYLHPIPKRDFVLRGKVEVWTLTQTETLKTVYEGNATFQIDAYTPHILHFLEDTVLIEWWWWPEDEEKDKKKGEQEGGSALSTSTTVAPSAKKDTTTGGDLQCWYYHPYRRIVDVHNSLVAPSTGHFQRYAQEKERANAIFCVDGDGSRIGLKQ